jgi:hypothetical protein
LFTLKYVTSSTTFIEFKIKDKFGGGDIVTYYNTSDEQTYYGMVISDGTGSFLETSLGHPEQWLKIRWLGNLPYGSEWDFINHTTNLVEKYVDRAPTTP